MGPLCAALRHGGLSSRYFLIRDCLTKFSHGTQQEATASYFVWTWLVLECEPDAITKAAEAGLAKAKATVNAVTAGLAVLKRKRVGRVWDMNP
jgi:hypothetical protein